MCSEFLIPRERIVFLVGRKKRADVLSALFCELHSLRHGHATIIIKNIHQ